MKERKIVFLRPDGITKPLYQLQILLNLLVLTLH